MTQKSRKYIIKDYTETQYALEIGHFPCCNIQYALNNQCTYFKKSETKKSSNKCTYKAIKNRDRLPCVYALLRGINEKKII